ncbi:MAG: hypothetical protein R3F11_09520 [Verrucomicrobiales bacterium]
MPEIACSNLPLPAHPPTIYDPKLIPPDLSVIRGLAEVKSWANHSCLNDDNRRRLPHGQTPAVQPGAIDVLRYRVVRR